MTKPDTNRNWQRISLPWWRLLSASNANNWVDLIQQKRPPNSDYLHLAATGKRGIYIVCDPAAIGQVFADQSGLFCRGEPGWTPLRRVLGNGLITADGQQHRSNRRAVAKLFKADILNQHARLISRYTQDWAERWRQAAGQTLDIHQEMILLTLKCTGRMLFGSAFAQERRFGQVFKNLNALTNRLDVAVFSMAPWLPAPANRTLKQGIKEIDLYINEMIQMTKQHDHDCLLSLLLKIQAEQDWHDGQLRDELVTLFAAGHESVAAALTWSWYLLDCYPSIAAKLAAEAETVLATEPNPYTQWQQLTYTRQVVKESMRLFPPVWFNGRKTTRATSLQGHPLPQGARIWLLPFLVQRDQRWFPQPLRMQPERFAATAETPAKRSTYFPFGYGARMCLGHVLAEMETSLILAGLIRQFRPHRPMADAPQLCAGTTLYPKDGMPMEIRPAEREPLCA